MFGVVLYFVFIFIFLKKEHQEVFPIYVLLSLGYMVLLMAMWISENRILHFIGIAGVIGLLYLFAYYNDIMDVLKRNLHPRRKITSEQVKTALEEEELEKKKEEEFKTEAEKKAYREKREEEENKKRVEKWTTQTVGFLRRMNGF